MTAPGACHPYVRRDDLGLCDAHKEGLLVKALRDAHLRLADATAARLRVEAGVGPRPSFGQTAGKSAEAAGHKPALRAERAAQEAVRAAEAELRQHLANRTRGQAKPHGP